MRKQYEQKEVLAQVLLAINGGEEAFETLYEMHKGLVWKEYVHIRQNLAEDEWAQECRLILMKCVSNFDIDREMTFSSYFKAALINHRYTLFAKIGRQNDRFQLQDNDFMELQLQENVGHVYEPNRAAVTEFNLMMWDEFSELTEVDIAVAKLFLQGYKRCEVAEKLNLPYHVVRKTVSHIKRVVQKHL